jgi:predicted MPP superfamily phosphohydrolase
MRWIEPQQIAIRETNLDLGVGKTVALIADLHVGVYKDRTYLQRVVNTINAQSWVDMVFIAGDLTFWPPLDQKKMEELFRPLSYLEVPVYMVLGNHDVEEPWPDIRTELVRTLEQYGVIFLDNDIVDFGTRKLVWLGDHMAGEDKVFILNQLHVAETVVVLTHNPDTTLAYANYNADATLVGHTHCGQVRVPWLHPYISKFIIPTRGAFDCWLMQTKYTTLLITPGLWEVVLPIRRFNPPTIDLVHF